MANLYEVLGVAPSASSSDIKQAYRRRSLETHPDRFPVGSQEQLQATGQFQEVNDAYYVLCDDGRRRDYDANRSSGDAKNGTGFAAGAGSSKDSEKRANEQFGSVYEEMMGGEKGVKEGWKHPGLYGAAGGLAGAVLGFIFANVVGALAGCSLGCCLGTIRDTRGKAVYEVYQDLPHAQKARVLSAMLAKVATYAGQVP
ncbi:unnamed protein product [Calypogeia fissa]